MEQNKTEVVVEEVVVEPTNEPTNTKSKKKKIIVASIIAAVVLIVAVVGFMVLRNSPKKEIKEPEKPTERYFAPANPTTLQTELYQLLLDADHANDEQKVKELVAASYAVDFFTWSNKGTRQEVGGVIYVIDAWKATFGTQAIQTYYRDFNELKNQFNQAGLPEVETYTIKSVEPTDYVLKEPLLEGNFNVTVDFTYKVKENAMPTDTLPKSVVVTIGKFEDRFVVVAVNYADVVQE